MADLLPETRAFLRDWLDWVERGAPNGAPYYRDDGLCDSSFLFDTSRAVSIDLDAAFGGRMFPFGFYSFIKREDYETQHECPKRLAWAREHAAEKSLSHSEGEEK